jgi:hypothetical protein
MALQDGCSEQTPRARRGLDLLGQRQEPVCRGRESWLQSVRAACPEEAHGPDQGRGPGEAQGALSRSGTDKAAWRDGGEADEQRGDIGAGLAGLAASWRPAADRHEIVVTEARDGVGARVKSLAPADGTPLELQGQVVPE